ncbi:hypothetical protein HGRIS_014253 [Hohenbuehelia grisea]|uniref:Uncharacterized protein n=1 Tax=Hohenbuehelia grisea TaxID=104357 RepID=A0ABR3JSY1_9AGAR
MEQQPWRKHSFGSVSTQHCQSPAVPVSPIAHRPSATQLNNTVANLRVKLNSQPIGQQNMPPRRHDKKLTVANPYPKVSPSAPDVPTNEGGYVLSLYPVPPKAPKGSSVPGQGMLMLTASIPIRVNVKVPDFADPGPGLTQGATTSPAPSVGPKAQTTENRNLPSGPQPGPSRTDYKGCHKRPRLPGPNGMLILKKPVDT